MSFVNKIKQKFKKNKKIVLIMTIFFASFLLCPFANAMDWVDSHLLDFLSFAVYWLVKLIGGLIGIFVWIFIGDDKFAGIVSFNNFINAEPVIIGWEIIRDICNMGFVIVLLIIAIASILQIQTYHYRTWLPKLVLMAILINFSKLICGILIDASQIVTLTFASGIQQIGAGNFFDALGINHLLNSNISEMYNSKEAEKGEAAGGEINGLSIAVTILLALVVAFIALIVITAITLIFIIRIVALWILIILSPFAYLFSASPLGHRYASQWWQKFSQWVITGPVMLFFIWLSLSTIKNLTSGMFSIMEEGAVPTVGLAEIGSPETMGAFILACVMLMASLIVAQQLGGYAAKIAGGAYSKITSTGDKIVSGSWAGIKTGADWVNRKQAKYIGPDLNLKRQWQEIWKPTLDESKRKDISDVQERGARLSEGEGLTGWGKGLIFGSKDFVRQRWSMEGFGRSARSTFGKSATQFEKEGETEDKKIEDNEEKLKNIMSQPEFDKHSNDLRNEEKNKTKVLEDKEIIDKQIKNAIADLKRAIHEAIVTGSGEYQGIHYGADELKEMLADKKEEKENSKVDIEEAEINLKNAKLDISNYNNKHIEAGTKGTLFTTDSEAKTKRDEIQKDINEAQEKSKYFREKSDKYRLDDFEARKAQRMREYEEKSKLYSQDSGELIKMFGNAVANNEKDRAAVITKTLMEQIDMNEILKSYGYNADSVGLTDKELKVLKDANKFDEIEKRKGMHDFMRDYMKDKLGMSEQRMLGLESQLGGIAKSTMQSSFMDAVSIKNGEYIQNNSAKQQELAATHLNKHDAETIARRESRFAFGGEKIDGSYRVNQAGLQWMMGNWATMNQQFKIGRPNVQNTIKLSEKENMRILRNAAEQLTGDNREGYEKMLDNLNKWGKRLRGAEISNMEERIDEAAKIINS